MHGSSTATVTMELQNLVKVTVKTLDSKVKAIVSIEMTVASVDGELSAEQVHRKVCDSLGLKASSRLYFSLFDKIDQPTVRYRPTDSIPSSQTDLYLCKWCLVLSEELTMLHLDAVAVHLVFLQAVHDVTTGKLVFGEADRQKLDECLQPGFMAEAQYVQLCQNHPDYTCVSLTHCTLLADLQSPSIQLKTHSLVNVSLSKFGVKLEAGEAVLTFTWYEMSHWITGPGSNAVTLVWAPRELETPVNVALSTPQAPLLLSTLVDMITILQKSDRLGATFHADMMSVTAEGSVVWENGVFNPDHAKTLHFSA